ncbi:MAG TPA: GNAT family N-acetyltransferase, partial [Deinococcales bacterium]|nr:GNAT family N-acetyltransferase [Deinococcales bacterium]
LLPHLRDVGGHIGYEVRPSRRREGHGREALRVALQEARKLGLRRALVTCNASNPGSRRIIEANGGILEDEREVQDYGRVRRYWIDL